MLRKYLIGFVVFFVVLFAMGGSPETAVSQEPERFRFDYISATPDVTNASIVVSTNYAATAQLNYGTNYHFIYDRKLTNTELRLNLANEHQFVLSGLIPETTYRYQIRCTDVSGNRIESNFFTFTTKIEE